MASDLPIFAPNGISWIELGTQGFETSTGSSFSGQVSAIAVDLVHDPTGNLVYVGSSSGGLWKSTNGLAARPRFLPLSDQTQSLSVGAVAVDPRTNPSTIYVGTGAPDNSANISSYTGVGILISRNDGRTWTLVDSADGGAHPFAGLGFSSLLVDPNNPHLLLASTGIGTDPNHPHTSVPQGTHAFDHLGIYRSTDAGQHWTQVMSAGYGSDLGASPLTPAGFFHIDLLYDAAQDRYLAGVSNVGLFVSTDRGATWASLQVLGLGAGLPAAADTHRVSLAARGNALWALILANPSVPPPYTGVFRLFESVDHGRSWQEDLTLPPVLPIKGCLMYVAAPPASYALLVAAERLFRRNDVRDPAQLWVEIGANVIHGDQHAIAFASAKSWYAGDDGGAWTTTDGGNRWIGVNHDLRTLEFLSAAADSGTSDSYVGGTQDNGPAYLTTGRDAWVKVRGGDGTYCAADPGDPGAFFLSGQFGDVQYGRVATPGVTTAVFTFDTALWKDFLMPYEILPTSASLYAGASAPRGFDFAGARIFLTAADNPWLVAFDANTLAGAPNSVAVRLSGDINQVIHYVAPFPSDPTSAYLVAGSSLFHLSGISFAGRAVVTPITGGPVNGDLLGHLAVSPAGTLYLTKVGVVDAQKIFKSADGGRTWTNISGNLPNTPVNWVMVDGDSQAFVYVATNRGVYVATDGGTVNEQWQRLGARLPNVPVTQIQRSQARKLIAATFGRGVWSLDVHGAAAGTLATIQLSPPSVVSGGTTTGTVTLTAPVWTRTRVGLVAVEPARGQLGPTSTIVTVPNDVFINAGDTQATFSITTTPLSTQATQRTATIYATAGATKWTTLTLT